jgi:hypothetical protein
MLSLLDFTYMLRKKRLVHVAQIGDFTIGPCGEFFGVNAATPVNTYNSKSHAIVYRIGFNSSTTRDGRHACCQANKARLSCGCQKLSAGKAAHLTHLQKVLALRPWALISQRRAESGST